MMVLPRDFRETLRDRTPREPAFRKALLREAKMVPSDRRISQPPSLGRRSNFDKFERAR